MDFEADQAYQPLPPAVRRMEPGEAKVLWEDRHLVFVDKPAGLLTVPTEQGSERSLADELKDHYARLGQVKTSLYIVHRLDRHTSGVLVFAKSAEAMRGLRKIFAEHDLRRMYRAVLVGELPENSGTLTDKLYERQKALIMSVAKGHMAKRPEVKQAVTHYRVVERLPGHTVVEVTLETGRRNQIRVQFAERGFPLLGDQVYGSPSPLLARQALHAELLGFRHPVNGDLVTVSAPLPADLQAALAQLRNLRRVVRAEAGVQGDEGIFQPRITKARKQAKIHRALKFSEPGDSPVEPRARPARTEGPPRLGGDRRPARGRSERPEGARPDSRAEGPRPRKPGTAGQPGAGRPAAGRPAAGRPAREGAQGRRPEAPRRPGQGARPHTGRPGSAPRPGSAGPRPAAGTGRPARPKGAAKGPRVPKRVKSK